MDNMAFNDAQKDVSAFLRTPLPSDWKSWSLEERRAFWAGDRQGGTVPRARVCSKEVYVELYNGDPSSFDPHYARIINRLIHEDSPYWKMRSCLDFPIYGRQRCFHYDRLAKTLEENSKQMAVNTA